MTWVKICGMTNLEDALTAVDAGADAVGFVFYEKSPRNISVEAAREIVRELPGSVEKVGVFVDLEPASIRDIVLDVGLSAVQLHEKGSKSVFWEDVRPAIEWVGASKLIRMIPGDTLAAEGILVSDSIREQTFAFLIDSQVNSIGGGTGLTFDWEAARGMLHAMSLITPVIVAGGLTPLNVTEAIKTFQPFGVDVASGVEARVGKKDPEKVRAFVKAVRDADRKVS